MVSVAQFCTAVANGCGAMKSFSSAVKEVDARLVTKALPNCVQTAVVNTPVALRLMAASPKVKAARGVLGLSMGSVTVIVLTAPSANPAALRSTRPPQHGGVAPLAS